jgi:dynein heavy chain
MYVEEQVEVPWETLNVSVAFITYGGRVTDIWDKRTIMSVLRKYFDPQLLDDSYCFTENKKYFAPAAGNIVVRCVSCFPFVLLERVFYVDRRRSVLSHM